MINLEFKMADGSTVMVYDVHPLSQDTPVEIPAGATGVVVWMGTRPVKR